jgi:hypothetical protein
MEGCADRVIGNFVRGEVDRGGPILQKVRSMPFTSPLTDSLARPKLFDRLKLPANGRDVTAEAVAEAAIVAIVSDGKALSPAWIAMCLDRARAIGELKARWPDAVAQDASATSIGAAAADGLKSGTLRLNHPRTGSSNSLIEA